MAQNRVKWIDVCKGICIFCVILGHMGILPVNDVVYAFHLTAFFVLSGYTLKNNFSATSVSYKFKKLMTPYFVTCFAVIVMGVVNLILIHKTTDTNAILQKVTNDLLRSFAASGSAKSIGSISMNGRIGAIWFLPALFFSTVIAQAILRYFKKTGTRFAIACTLSLVAYLSARVIWFPFSIQSGLFALPLILIGYEARQRQLFDKLKLVHVIPCFVIFVIGIVTKKASISFVTAYMSDVILSSVYALASTVCIIYISKLLTFSKIFVFMGRYSLYYLCAHLFEMETMYYWYEMFANALHIPLNKMTLFIMKVLFCTVVTFIILGIKRIHVNHPKVSDSRDVPLDVAKGILIILMIIGHFSLPAPLRKAIYSFHMPAFIVLSGYMFNPKRCENLKNSLLNLCRHFALPTVIFATGYLAFSDGSVANKIKTLVLSVSFSKKIFAGTPSIGPVYFISLLLLVRIIYMLLCRFVSNELYKNCIIFTLTICGVWLGKAELWLPWSFDIALYSVALYHIGYYLKKYDVISLMCRHCYSYFILSVVWLFSVHYSGVELATRNYGVIGLAIIGAVCATILIYMLSNYIHTSMPGFVSKVFSLIGKNTIYVLIIHTLFQNMIFDLVSAASLTYGYIYHFVLSIVVCVVLGTAVGVIVSPVQNLILKSRK